MRKTDRRPGGAASPRLIELADVSRSAIAEDGFREPFVSQQVLCKGLTYVKIPVHLEGINILPKGRHLPSLSITHRASWKEDHVVDIAQAGQGIGNRSPRVAARSDDHHLFEGPASPGNS